MGWLRDLFRNRSRRDEQTSTVPEGTFRNATALPDGDPPEWLRAVPVGDFPEHPDGPHEITRDVLDEMVANFERTNTDLLIDVEHQSLWGDSRAAGWSTEVEARDDGLYVRFPEWTPYGGGFIENREYRYLSPVYQLDGRSKQGQRVGARLISIALTNSPYFDEEIDVIGNTRTEPDDDTTDEPDSEDFMDREELIEHLGLDEDATDEDIENALAEAKAAREAAAQDDDPDDEPDEGEEPEDAPAGGDGDDSDPEDLDAKINSAVAKALADRDQSTQAEQLVDQAIEDGKMEPAERDVWLNSARANFKTTKKALEKKQAGSAMPSGLSVRKNSTRPATSPLKGSTAKYLDELGV